MEEAKQVGRVPKEETNKPMSVLIMQVTKKVVIKEEKMKMVSTHKEEFKNRMSIPKIVSVPKEQTKTLMSDHKEEAKKVMSIPKEDTKKVDKKKPKKKGITKLRKC